MEVRLAAAEVIQDISKWPDCRSFLRERSTVLDLCRCSTVGISLNRNQSLQPSMHCEIPGPSIRRSINRKILPPLVCLLDDTCTETAISACRVLRKPMILEDNDEILQHLTPLLSHADDEIFVEAAWSASVLAWHDPLYPLPTTFTSTTIQRLVGLLHHREERVVVSALHGIADARCLRHLWTDFLLKMADEGGVHHLIDLLRSRNLAMAESALLVMDSIRRVASLPAMRHFLKHGIIESLLQTHAPWDQTMSTSSTRCTIWCSSAGLRAATQKLRSCTAECYAVRSNNLDPTTSMYSIQCTLWISSMSLKAAMQKPRHSGTESCKVERNSSGSTKST